MVCMDSQKFRDTIPLLRNHKEIVYLDSATTTLVPDGVLHKMNDFYQNIGVIPNRGAYDLVIESNKILNNTRKTVSEFLNVNTDRIAFTNSTSHGSATAASLAKLIKDDRVIFASNLHNSSFLNWYRMAKTSKSKIEFIELETNGQISLSDLELKLASTVKGRTFVLLDHSPMGFGTLLQLNETSNIIHEKDNAYLFLDATRTAGFIDIDIKKHQIDYLVCQGQTTLFGPQGIGLVVFPKIFPGEPHYIGSGSIKSCSKNGYILSDQPSFIETDGANIAGIIGLKAGIEIINDISKRNIRNHCSKLMGILVSELKGYNTLNLYSNELDMNSGLLGFNVEDMNCHDIAFYLNETGDIYVRAGEQCTHLIMQELGLNKNFGLVQVSFSYYTSENDIRRFLIKLKEIIEV